MCLWLLTACLGLLPGNPTPPVIIVPGVPSPIILPTTTTTTTTAPPGNNDMTGPPEPPPTEPPATEPPPTDSTTIPTVPPTPPPTTGPLPIDPRLGTTPAPSAPLQVPPITGYSALEPSYNTAVRFPRQRRNVDFTFKDIFHSTPKEVYVKHRIYKRQSCRCVAIGTCIRPSTGAGLIDIRIVNPGGGGGSGECPAGQESCCGGITDSQIACGILQTTPPLSVTPTAGQANFGEYPWQAMILTKQNDYIAGGVLIDPLNVLTVTHRLLPYIVSGTAPNVKVRLGEWDAAGTYEPVPYQEYAVQKVFSHPSYNSNTLQYDITVLRLAAPVPFTPAAGAATTINRACLPSSPTATYNGHRCWVAGWGKNMFGVQGQYQQILKEVEVPIVAPATCQSQLQAARLGPTYVLDTTSFICAGGEPNKDSCTGDGGSGLVCSVNGQWVVVGLVSWGLGCANANVPAAYVNVAALLPWIQQQIATP
ncbi:phenoloxidase-activating factor 2-like isoform X2 [Galleria mellonella]|uniref:Phenoloxidase-activating factor 2-like isoform X2 n=1 Tax=Galleria mellonella TaxID=7137 RepID=A0A6J3C921_GALME|nr:phenoloxidase-activating factor 2-like isoform X2 [Galleria mellonella]